LARDTNGPIYRCFLPDLTGFIGVCYVSSIFTPAASREPAKRGLS